MLNRRNPTKRKKLHHVKEIATWDKLGRVGTSWEELGQAGTSWDKLGQVGTSWEPKKLQNFDIKKNVLGKKKERRRI